MTSDGNSAERRAFPRYETNIRARVVDEDGTERDAAVRNLSEGGALIDTDALPTSELVRIELELEGLGWRALDAEVVRSEPTDDQTDHGGRLAARFADVATSGERGAIRAFLQEHFAD